MRPNLITVSASLCNLQKAVRMSPLYLLVTLALCVCKIHACSCPDVWTLFGKSCYFFGHRTHNFHDSERYCHHRNSHLVHIEDEAENAFLKKHVEHLKADKFWIGLTDKGVEGVWRWYSTEATMKYVNWNPGQPNQGRRSNCGAIWGGSYNYNWVDEPCGNHFIPICEQPQTSTFADEESGNKLSTSAAEASRHSSTSAVEESAKAENTHDEKVTDCKPVNNCTCNSCQPPSNGSFTCPCDEELENLKKRKLTLEIQLLERQLKKTEEQL